MVSPDMLTRYASYSHNLRRYVTIPNLIFPFTRVLCIPNSIDQDHYSLKKCIYITIFVFVIQC